MGILTKNGIQVASVSTVMSNMTASTNTCDAKHDNKGMSTSEQHLKKRYNPSRKLMISVTQQYEEDECDNKHRTMTKYDDEEEEVQESRMQKFHICDPAARTDE